MAATTAIMHSTGSALGSGGTGSVGTTSSATSVTTAPSSAHSSSSASSSSNASHSPEGRVCSSDDEEVLLPSLMVDTQTTNSDSHSEGAKEEEEEEEEEEMQMTDEEDRRPELKMQKEEEEDGDGQLSLKQSKDTSEDADDSSTIVGDNEDDENSQLSIEIDSSPKEMGMTKAEEASSVASPMAIGGGLFGTSNSTKAASNGSKKLSTGKLERITAALAKKQTDGQVPSNLLESLASLHESLSPALNVMSSTYNDDSSPGGCGRNSVAPPESSATTISEDEDEDLEDDDEDDEDMLLDEEDEEIQNGFRALGLMGNVAFMGEEKFKCPVCGIKLDSQHTFTLHIRSHNPNDHSNTCRLCGKTLSSASSLDRHMLIHSGERPFKCSICNMAFTTNGNMHRHMRTHGHGAIGYTPRGAKRRAKLFAQQAAKVAAAAAAGEPVDAATINKLKKSALEVTTGNGKSPISGTPMKKQRGAGRRSADPFAGVDQLMAGGINGGGNGNPAATLAEAEQIAAAAAAYAASVATSSEPSPKGHSLKKQNTHHSHSSSTTSPFSFHQALGASHHHSLTPPGSSHHQNHQKHQQQQPSVPLNLTGWPADLAMLHGQAQPAPAVPVIPQKGKPGRKKKIRLPEELASPSQVAPGAQFPAGAFANLTAPTMCPICTCRVGSKMELHLHMTSFHGGEKLFCLDCGMILENYNIYTQHHCTVTAAAVMSALSANPQANAELLFRSTNTSRMNFSSARFPGLPGNHGHAAHGPLNPSLPGGPQDHLSSLMSQLSKSLSSGQSPFPGKDSPFFNPQAAQQSRGSHHHHGNQQQQQHHHQSQLPIVDLSAKSKHHQHHNGHSGSAGSFSGQPCGQCDRKFANTKQLKQHFDTFCHECSTDCGNSSGLMNHQIQHSIEKFPNLSKALGNGTASEGFNNAMAAALPGLLGMQTASHPLVANAMTSQRVASPNLYHKRHSYPKPTASPSSSLDLSLASSTAAASGQSSIASLTSTMADMNPDLADIQSIISMAKHAKLPLPAASSSSSSHTGAYKPVPSLSPNRASDAGIDSKKSVRHGDATSHPDSPASADSAAAAVASATSGGHSSQLATTSLTVDTLSKAENGHHHETAKTNGDAEHHDDGDYLEDEEDEAHLLPPTKRRRRRSPSGSPIKSDNGKSYNSTEHSPDSEAQRFRCEPCRLSFKSMNAFRRHNRGHTAGGGHSHACHLCPYKSLDKSTLIRHLRTHNGERPFQCAICKYAFTTKANCERHVRKRHRNLKSKSEIRNAMQYNRDMAATAAATKMVSEKIFIERDELPTSQDTVCKQCSVDFGTNRELRAHLRVPNNPCSQQLKPFVCTICKIGFNTRNNCVRHIIKQHPATIECADEDTAKLISAVNASAGAGETAESLIIETGSSASLSPGGSGGQMSGHSGFSDRSFSGSEHGGMSECESYGTYDEEPKSSTSPMLISPNSNASFAALCQVAAVEKRLSGGGSGAGGAKSPVELIKKAEPKKQQSYAALNLSCRSESDEDVLDLSRPKRSATQAPPVNGGLDLSVKTTTTTTSLPVSGKFNGSLKPAPEDSMLLMRNNAASSLMSLYKSEAEQQAAAAAMAMVQQQGHFDAMAAATFAKYGHPGITNETLANLMAQFHQHQAAQFAAMKSPSIAKNH